MCCCPGCDKAISRTWPSPASPEQKSKRTSARRRRSRSPRLLSSRPRHSANLSLPPPYWRSFSRENLTLTALSQAIFPARTGISKIPFGQGAADTVTDPRFARITGRMVLSHTSGLPNWSRRQPLTLLADPGSKWSYSGEGYVYLQRVIETITGEPLQTFVLSAVLTPLHMDHSSFVWKPEFAAIALSPPHRRRGGVGACSLRQGTCILDALLDDYARFVTALLHPQPGSPFALEESPQVVVNDSMRLKWGLGLAIESAPTKAYFHWGANPGFQSFFMVQPALGRSVLFLTDSDDGLDLVDTAVAHFVPGKHPVLRFPMLHPKD